MAVVADVCGKGPRAAALTAAARYTLRAAGDPRPAELLTTLDRELRSQGDEERFVTVALARLTVAPDGRSATALISVGGHPPPLVVRADGSVEEPRIAGTIVGVLDETSFGEVEVGLGQGDALLLYTDGGTRGAPRRRALRRRASARRGRERRGRRPASSWSTPSRPRCSTGCATRLRTTSRCWRSGSRPTDAASALGLVAASRRPSSASLRLVDRIVDLALELALALVVPAFALQLLVAR